MPPKKMPETVEPTPSGKRWFKVLVDKTIPEIDENVFSTNGGRYCGSNPRQAAGKAFTSLCKAAGEGGHEYIFSVQETTRGGKSRVFTYSGIRTELETPQVVSRGGTEYNIRFDYKVRAYKENKVAEVKAPKKKKEEVAPVVPDEESSDAEEVVPMKKVPAKKEPVAKKEVVKKTPVKKVAPKKAPAPTPPDDDTSDEEVSE